MKKIDVLLTADVANLGRRGDIKRVAGGYAKNALFPKRLARPARQTDRDEADNLQRQQLETAQQQHTVFVALAGRLGRETFMLQRAAHASGTLFGSVKAADLADAVRQKGFTDVADTMMRLSAPITRIGEYRVRCQFDRSVATDVLFIIRPRDSST